MHRSLPRGREPVQQDRWRREAGQDLTKRTLRFAVPVFALEANRLIERRRRGGEHVGRHHREEEEEKRATRNERRRLQPFVTPAKTVSTFLFRACRVPSLMQQEVFRERYDMGSTVCNPPLRADASAADRCSGGNPG